jgi:hypothetical protein
MRITEGDHIRCRRFGAGMVDLRARPDRYEREDRKSEANRQISFHD